MVSCEKVRHLALQLPAVEERDHFGKPSFRTNNRIFSTLWIPEKRAMVKLAPAEQTLFCEQYPDFFHPVPGGWGRMGSTFVELSRVPVKLFSKALRSAWSLAAAKKPARQRKPNRHN